MAFIPEVECRFADRGCKQKIQVTKLKDHIKSCKFHPSRTCRKPPETPEGRKRFDDFFKPALKAGGMSAGAMKGSDLEQALCSDDALLPGFVEVLAEGICYDNAESLTPETKWYPLRAAILQGQADCHKDEEGRRRNELLEEAVEICLRLLPPETSREDACKNVDALMAREVEGCASNFMELSEASCLAIEAACQVSGREATAKAVAQLQRIPSAVQKELAVVLPAFEIPAVVRLRPLRPSPLPEESLEVFRKRFASYQRASPSQAPRRLRLDFRDYPWVSREQVEMVLAGCEGREYPCPRKPLPGYWTSGAELPGYLFSLVDVPVKEHWRFQAAFDLTTRNVVTKDRKADMPDRLEVLDVKRVENEKAWSEFVHRRRVIGEQRGDGAIANIEDVKLGQHIFPGQQRSGDPGIVGLDNAQEYYLFHGTNQKGAHCIAEQDFSTEFSSEFSLFGPGLYFAECVTKSDEYCEEEGDDKICTMLVCRVCLGDHLHVPEVSVDPREVMERVGVEKRHSVLGDREACRGTYREFISYDSQACYAEYIVRYRRCYGPQAVQALEKGQATALEKVEKLKEDPSTFHVLDVVEGLHKGDSGCCQVCTVS